MLDIQGRSSLEWLVSRLDRSAHVQKKVFATTTDATDDVIAHLARRLGHDCFRGSEDDVLGRVLGAAKSAGLDIIVHVTGDCPLLDPGLADEVINLYLSEQADYASIDSETYPRGLDVEVFSTEALGRVERDFQDPWIREHVTEPFYTMPERFSSAKLYAPPELSRPHYRVCIDTEEDYGLVKQIFANLLVERQDFGVREMVALLDLRPDLAAINAGVKQTKYPAAVIGLGRIGALYDLEPSRQSGPNTHAGCYQRHGKTRLAAACDVDPVRRTEFVENWRVESVYSTADELFSNENPSIVSIATPPATHGEICLQAIEAGVRAILCEKPFVLDPDVGKEVIRACRDRGVLLAVNHWMRWSNLYRNARAFLAAGEIGDVVTARCHYSKGAMNSGTHAVDLLRFLFGEIRSAQATERVGLDMADDNLGGVLQTAAGFPVHLTVSDYRHHFAFEVDVMGTGGRFRATDDSVEWWSIEERNSSSNLKSLRRREPPFGADHGSPFVSAVSQLVDYLDTGVREVACTAEDGLRAVEVVLALQRSFAAGGASVVVA